MNVIHDLIAIVVQTNSPARCIISVGTRELLALLFFASCHIFAHCSYIK